MPQFPENAFVAVVGSRDFTDDVKLNKVLDSYHTKWKIKAIVCGMARGADLLGKDWADKNKIPVIQCPAEWNKFDKPAGHIRNALMADIADMTIAFWDQKSTGTKGMIDIVQQKKKPYYVFKH